MALMLWVGPAMIGFYLFYTTQMDFLIESVDKPGATFDIVS
jgi:hypothetical protein